ncbi:MAG: hypothetical protein K0U98_10545 [Deltaproteobacteria bacterium]|nr:hypothetical protein [Deltaproteobacteria bacterium]
MGCDIHLFVEIIEGDYVSALADGQFRVSRNYELFRALAGIRAEPGFAPLIEPRGLPEIMSRSVFGTYYQPILDEKTAVEWRAGDWVTPDEAKRYEHRVSPSRGQGWIPSEIGYVPYPDWHTPSWLTRSEVHRCLEAGGLRLPTYDFELEVVLEAMAFLELHNPKISTRVVFWFDN